MAKTICQHCSEEKDKIYQKSYRNISIYVDALEKRWYGTQCPDCYKKYKLAYDAKRRKEIGHKPLGSDSICVRCSNVYSLDNGASPCCKACRGKE